MPDSTFDQNAWLQRIGYASSREPTLATLKALVLRSSADGRRMPSSAGARLSERLLHTRFASSVEAHNAGALRR